MTRNRPLTLVCEVFHPDEQATSQLLSSLLPELVRNGTPCSVLSGFPFGGPAGQAVNRIEEWLGVTIRRGGLRIDRKKSLFRRALGYGSYSLWLHWRLLFCTPAHTRVMVVTNPPFAPVFVYWCSCLRGWRYQVVLHDLYPDGLVAVGKLSGRSILATIWRKLNQLAFARAEKIVVLGRDMAQLVQARYRVGAEKVVFLPNWNPRDLVPEDRPEATRLWRQLGLDGSFVVQYSGNMGLWHDLECIVRAAKLLEHEPRVRFLLIGDGVRKAGAEKLGRALSLRNIVWLPYQPKEQLSDSLACCHVALISQRSGLEGVAVPSKLYGILASGRAVLAQAPAGSEVALVLAEEECGITTKPGDAGALAEAIRSLGKDDAMVSLMGVRARQASVGKYALGMAVKKFEEILQG